MKKRVDNYRVLRSIAKKIVKKGTLKRIGTVSDKREREILYEYTIKSALELRYAEIKEKIGMLEKRGKDVFIMKTKMHLLGSRIHFFNASFQKDDFKKIRAMFKELEKEIKH